MPTLSCIDPRVSQPLISERLLVLVGLYGVLYEEWFHAEHECINEACNRCDRWRDVPEWIRDWVKQEANK